jgi:hypothetical protein
LLVSTYALLHSSSCTNSRRPDSQELKWEGIVGGCVQTCTFVDGPWGNEPFVLVNVIYPIQPYPSLLITYLRR